LGSEIDYFLRVQDYNEAIPENLYLLPGDCDLDGCAEIIDYVSGDPTIQNRWVSSRKFLCDIIPLFEQQHKKDTVVFLDTNPSFANYTQASVIASQRIIVPCTADHASIRALYNVFYRIFNISEIDGRVNENNINTFYDNVKEAGIILPKIHLFILNKSRSHSHDASRAYQAHIQKIAEIVSMLAEKYGSYFTDSGNNHICNVKDGNTLSAVLNHTGLIPSNLQHRAYDVYGKQARVNDSQIQTFLADIRNILHIL
jgi:cellulose biosynthesis protein BcsQ